MLARQALLYLQNMLQQASFGEAKREAQLICAYLCGVEPSQLALYPEKQIGDASLNNLLARRLAGEPLQYVLGEAGFMGLTFVVGPGALIPRPDTEVLVEKAIFLLKEAGAPLIADIGAGPGTIAVSLAYHLPQAMVYGVDISQDALLWAEKNRYLHGVSERCHFFKGNLLAPLQALGLRFDLIISNPPYVTEVEMAQLLPIVQGEPTLALYGGTDGLDFYRPLAQQAAPLLKPAGFLLLEHGWQQQNQVKQLLLQEGWQIIECLADLGGRDRGILVARQPKASNKE
ncbi:MAG: peptide chain release factor N(5)-glutamine methyltransferase [Firmicutes bacterium]|nr:peptide chain release factor N(5)-glutamine methyltransferase [Bacillota bacterium]